MKHIVKWMIAILVGTSMFFASCVDQIKFGDAFLEKPPSTSDLNQDSIFGRAEYARAFLWDVYGELYYGLPYNWGDYFVKGMNCGKFEALSDCFHSHLSWDGVNRLYYSGSYVASDEETSAGDVRFSYNDAHVWRAVRAAWLFIENVGRVPDMPDSEKARLTSEAKVIIASRYFDAFRHFGGLPLLRQSYGVQESYEIPRATAEETVNFMTGLLDEAIADANLPWSLGSDEANWQGRMTKAAAMALKCKILVFAASPLYNDSEPYCTESPQDAVDQRHVWYGGYSDEWWSRLYTACTDFFNALQTNGFYQLMQADGTNPQDYRDAYYDAYATRENNTELLISTRVIGQFNGDWWYYFWDWIVGQGGGGPGAFTPTLEFMEMFPMADGTPYDPSTMEDGVNPFFIDNDNNQPVRDPRLYETMLVNGEPYGDHAIELWIGGRDNVNSTLTESDIYATGFGLYKFFTTGEGAHYGSYPEWPYLRLSEMYLIYAEALLHQGRLQEAIDQVDIVRARVGLGGLAECNPDKNLLSDSDALLEEILRERACELGFEDVRLFDMIRYKRADLFQRPLHGLRIYRLNDDGTDNTRPWSGSTGDGPNGTDPEFGNTHPNKPTKFRYETFQLRNIERSWWTNFSPKWYLSAFPPSEVNKGFGLTQNPGWN